MPIYSGASKKNTPTETRVDTRRLSLKLADNWSTPDGGWALTFYLLGGVLAMLMVPLGTILYYLPSKLLAKKFLHPKNNLHDMPYRMPVMLQAPDGSAYIPNRSFRKKANKKMYTGKGVTLYGNDLATGLQVWGTDSDDRTHTTILGTTGSGKTEFIFGLVLNQLIRDSGFIAIDAKGDISFQRRTCQLLRAFGREDDLLTISFAVGTRDFLQAQLDKPTNTFNIMSSNSAGMLIELLSGLLDGDGGGDDMWKGRAIAFIAAITRPLVYLRDKQELELSPQKYMDFMELSELERFVYGDEYNKYPNFEEVLKPLKGYLTTLPGYNINKKYNQEQQTNEQFGYITMQLTRAINDLGYNYGHIFGTEVGEIDISDVVLNRRCLTGLLPSLERSLPTLTMLGRLLIGSIKQMMAGSLGSSLEGTIRIGVDSRPTTARNSFRIILDEVGYMMVTGMSVIPAQARSLNIAMTFAAQDYTDIKRGSAEEAEAIWSNSNLKFIGRLVSGEKSETWEKVSGLAGTKDQMAISGYETYFSITGDLAYRPSQQIQHHQRSQADYHDLAAQENGEFTLLTPKKYQGGKTGGVAVIHLLGLYTAGGVELQYMYLNDFVPISVSDATEVGVYEQREKIKDYLRKGELATQLESVVVEKTVNGNNISNSLIDLLYQIQEQLNRQQENTNFIQPVLELSLGNLNIALGDITQEQTSLPTNVIEGVSVTSAFDPIDIEGRQSQALDDVNNAYSHSAQAQQKHIKTYDVPEKITNAKNAVYAENNRAVDLNKDDQVREVFEEHLANDAMHSLMNFESVVQPKQLLQEELMAYCNSIKNKNSSLHTAYALHYAANAIKPYEMEADEKEIVTRLKNLVMLRE